MLDQRICGVFMILLSIGIIILALRGTTPEDKDITVVLFLLPLGVYALFGKERIFYDNSFWEP